MKSLPSNLQNQLFRALLDSTQVASVITDPNQPDNPIVYTNQIFLELTGYTESEVIGRNCRFLQGEKTDDNAVQAIRKAISVKEPITLTLQNHKKDGTPFWNQLHIEPVYIEDTLFFISSQLNITQEIEQKHLLSEKEKELAEQLLPIIPLDSTIGILALVGKMTKERLNVLVTKLSLYVQDTSTEHIIIDITGSLWEDEFFQHDLLMIQDVLRLMGSQLYISGITPYTAIKMTSTQHDKTTFTTFSSVEQAVSFITREI